MHICSTDYNGLCKLLDVLQRRILEFNKRIFSYFLTFWPEPFFFCLARVGLIGKTRRLTVSSSKEHCWDRRLQLLFVGVVISNLLIIAFNCDPLLFRIMILVRAWPSIDFWANCYVREGAVGVYSRQIIDRLQLYIIYTDRARWLRIHRAFSFKMFF